MAVRRSTFKKICSLIHLTEGTKSDLFKTEETVDMVAVSVEAGDSIRYYAAYSEESRQWLYDIRSGSVALIRVNGFISDGVCAMISDFADVVSSDDKVTGIVIQINSPGGTVTGVQSVASALYNSAKPVAVRVTGMCCSAAYWIASGAGKIFLSSPSCEVGSVGTMGIYVNSKEAMKSEGYDVREIYPDTSDLKNRPSRDIEENDDETAFKAHLSRLHRLFCDDVARGRKMKYDPADPLFRGATLMGDDAVKACWADGYATLPEAVRWVSAQQVVREANRSV